MSTVWKGDTYVPAGHSDGEQMKISRHFNTPCHNMSEGSKSSTLEISGSSPTEQRDEEDGVAARHAKTEKSIEPIISPGAPELPSDGRLTAWLQGKYRLIVISSTLIDINKHQVVA